MVGLERGFPSVRELYERVVGEVSRYLPVEVGVSVSSGQGWQRVGFTRRFTRVPTVVGVMDVSQGSWAGRSFSVERVGVEAVRVKVVAPRVRAVELPAVSLPPPPKIDLPGVRLRVPDVEVPPAFRIPRVSVPKWEVPRVGRPDFAGMLVREAVRNGVLASLGYWGWAYDWMKWKVLEGIIKLAWFVGGTMNVMWDSYVQPQIDRVRNTINSAIGGVVDRVNEVLDAVVSGVNYVSKEARDRVQKALDEFKRWVEEDLNGFVGELEKGLEDSVNKMAEGVYGAVQAALDDFSVRVADALNEGLSEWSGSLAAGVEEAVNSGLEAVAEGVNRGFEGVAGEIRRAVDESVRAVYEVVGVPEGWRFTPVLVRNVGVSGFEWWAPSAGVKFRWVAVAPVL